MKKGRIIFFSIFAAYQLIVFLITLYIRTKQQDLVSLYALLSYITIFVYGALLGMVLILIDFIWTLRATKQSTSEEEALRLENNVLKAKIYDLQENSKGASHVAPPATK
jgi:hypothetical protein